MTLSQYPILEIGAELKFVLIPAMQSKQFGTMLPIGAPMLMRMEIGTTQKVTLFNLIQNRYCKFYLKGKPVKHQQLLEEIDELEDSFIKVRLVKVPAHDGERGNEGADRLAKSYIDSIDD